MEVGPEEAPQSLCRVTEGGMAALLTWGPDSAADGAEGAPEGWTRFQTRWSPLHVQQPGCGEGDPEHQAMGALGSGHKPTSGPSGALLGTPQWSPQAPG